MVFTYLLGRTDSHGRNVIEMLADKVSNTRVQSTIVSVVSVIVIGNLLYGAVFAPHLATKLSGYVTSGPSEQLFPGVPNQPR
jgi:Spirocyclase AveC-like